MKNGSMGFDIDDPRLTAYALDELPGNERPAVEAWLAENEAGRREIAAIRAQAQELERDFATLPAGELSGAQRGAIEAAADGTAGATAARGGRPRTSRPAGRRRRWLFPVTLLVAASIAGVLVLPHLLGEAEEKGGLAPFTYSLLGDPPPPATAPLTSDLEALGYQSDKALTAALEDAGYVGEPAPSGRLGGKKLLARGRTLLDAETRRQLQGLGYMGDVEAPPLPEEPAHNEAYDYLPENPFRLTRDEPRSTFSIDVDTASYANVRRFLNEDRLPPPDAVRTEELVNYFPYDYAPPVGIEPFSVDVAVASAPWQPEHRLVRIALRGREVSYRERRPSNLVFLLDVSGSMDSPDKLPLLKRAMAMLVEQLGERDRVAIAVYAGASGLVLPSTSAADKPAILEALERLRAGGSTHGSAGIELAYATAQAHFEQGGINRVILCTDGDFNVGVSDRGSLVRMVQERAKRGVFLTVLGFGRGNLKDSHLEELADRGNGNYAYVDSDLEARKVLVEELGGTLETIAKDVKIQVELNPDEARAWRLVGYENRVLAHRDFDDDRKDAGDIGSGHTVTALYEVVPRGASLEGTGVAASAPLRYRSEPEPSAAAQSGELLHVKLRYKRPDANTSELLEVPVRDDGLSWEDAGEDFRFAAAVAAFGMHLRRSEHDGDAELEAIVRWAQSGLGADPGGYRVEFLRLVLKAQALEQPRQLDGGKEDLGYVR